eukprot:TRINITY_DN48361_c0_g1_i1.p1 TRINITY_DN48361_c0_g1~~TRINITY_DN48361_c0_g1_i1.p1  ORF type:complete len:534 (+),score=59.24 TRINITY_DN48361_c0_g1_i1:51-1604(+)
MLQLVFLFALARVLAASPDFSTLPLPSFGAEVRGLHVSELVRLSRGSPSEQAEAKELVTRLRAALHAQRILAFRGLGSLSWQDQKAFSALFGKFFNESAHSNRAPHPAVPDHHVARFSNNPKLGSTSAGTEGWHVDGNVVRVPHAITFIHAISAIPDGDTMFVPLREVVHTLRKQGYLRGSCTERAPPCSNRRGKTVNYKKELPALDDVIFQSGHVQEIRHPLVYAHPVTGLDTMMFGLGKLSGIYRHGCLQPALPTSLMLTEKDTGNVAETIQIAIESSNRVLRWRWADGDLLMVDNLAVAHHASDGTQASWEEVGVRLMQRTTVAGAFTPLKRPLLHSLAHECMQDESSDGDESGQFDSREVARQQCRRVLSPSSDLAIPLDRERNTMMGRVVSSVGKPHWIGGDDYPNGHVTWLNGLDASEGFGPNASYPWHAPSGQPNDCDGPGSETCMFMGPDAKWFDFACQPKVPNATAGVTAGPEIKWNGDEKRMYDIHVLCGLRFHAGEAAQLGLRMAI